MQLSCKLAALTAIAFYNEVDALDLHNRGQLELRYRYVFQTKSLLTVIAIKMCMQILHTAMAIPAADRIFY
jgi:hypothetical protein